MLRVLVTRPGPGASRTAAVLKALGYEPVLLPLSETRATPVDSAALPEVMNAVAVTSANALRHAPAHIVRRFSALPCYAVGAKTGAAARTAGFSDVVEGPGDALSLADRISQTMAGRSIAYLCGRVRFPRFEERLAAAGVHVRPVETYDTVMIDHTSETVTARLDGRPIDAVLLYSAQAAQAAGRLMARPELRSLLGKADVLALSGRVAAAFGPDMRGATRIAEVPTEEALLALLPAPR
ncbi:uroporphyrinogen-III synthase [Mesorhizobium sp. SP-1A]|uniref:uroporphyrinogen-III synthase n=1 Tax=Mesorhizobium sp. SP-1A TaxID=3077840 RepID=UPI0028F6E29A|nr:uroporphyrinogen-III synthase [Mesorhizobium sp. SP-1A]